MIVRIGKGYAKFPDNVKLIWCRENQCYLTEDNRTFTWITDKPNTYVPKYLAKRCSSWFFFPATGVDIAKAKLGDTLAYEPI